MVNLTTTIDVQPYLLPLKFPPAILSHETEQQTLVVFYVSYLVFSISNAIDVMAIRHPITHPHRPLVFFKPRGVRVVGKQAGFPRWFLLENGRGIFDLIYLGKNTRPSN